MKRAFLQFTIGLLGALAAGSVVVAQSAYPSKPVTLVVPFPPGGALDIVARALADEMRKHLGQPVIVENRAGAGGTLGTGAVARAAPDGHTIMLGSVATHAIAPALYRTMSYDALKDFVPITQVTASPLLVASSATLNVSSLPELLAMARAQPGKLNYASTGNGTAVHLAGELLKSAAKLDVVHVPYKGGSEAMTALITGEASYIVVNVELVMPQVRGGKARALAVTGSRRLPFLPDVPTLREAGVTGADVSTWFGLFAPAGTPKAAIDRLQRDAATSLQTLKERFAAQGDESVGSTPEEFAALVRGEHAKWAKIVKDSGVKLD